MQQASRRLQKLITHYDGVMFYEVWYIICHMNRTMCAFAFVSQSCPWKEKRYDFMTLFYSNPDLPPEQH
jgi:hypothetical protein